MTYIVVQKEIIEKVQYMSQTMCVFNSVCIIYSVTQHSKQQESLWRSTTVTEL